MEKRITLRGVIVILFILFAIPINSVFAELSPVPSWVARYNGDVNKDDDGRKIATDSLGNVYVTGWSSTLTVGEYVTIKYNSDGTQLWVSKYSDNVAGYPTGMVVDSLGNVYVVGSICKSVDFCSDDYVTIKYDTNGNQLWVAKYDNGFTDQAKSLSVDFAGNVYVTGSSYHDYDSNFYQNTDYATVKYDTNGNQLWVSRYDSGRPDSAKAITTDFSGAVYITGASNNNLSEYATVKYDTNGNQLWVARYNSGRSPVAIIVDKAGDVYVAGYGVNSQWNVDYVIVKYDTNGNQLWATKYDNGFEDSMSEFSLDNQGGVYVTGKSRNLNGLDDYATVKYDTNGNQLWVSRYDNGNTDFATSLSVDSSGSVYVAGGSYKGSGTTYDIATIKYDTNGNQLWVSRYDNGKNDTAYGTKLDFSGNIYVVGNSFNGVNLDYVLIKYSAPRLSSTFFSSIKNTQNSWSLRKTAGTQNKPIDDVIKTVPNDWVFKVTSTTDADGVNVDLDGYRWYQVEDITDGAVGWMAAKNLTDGTVYLSNDAANQSALEAKATSTPYLTKEARIPVIIDAVNNYYSAPATNSLYGSGGGLGNANNFQKFIQGSAFPKELVLAVAAQESGSLTSTSFNNEIVTFDYGHGIMQSTFVASTTNAMANTWDNRGVGSGVTTPLCKSIFSNDYKKCYANSETPNNLRKPYQHYDGNPVNPIYKQYANTYQSIYSNIKDGFRVIQEKYRKKCPQSDVVISGETFTCQDIEKMLTVWGYNGFAKNRTTGLYTGTYLKDVAEKLESLSSYFPGVVYSDQNFIQKMKIANAHKQVIRVYSPVTLSVIDSTGRITGLVNDAVLEEIPSSLYEKSYEAAVIFSPTDTYKYRVVGTSSGTYGFSVNDTEGDSERSFSSSNIPIVQGEIHEYAIDWKALARGERGVTVSIDVNGDGTPERLIHSDDTLSEIVPPTISIISPTEQYVLNATTTIQFTASDASGIASTTAILNGVLVSNGQTVTLTRPGTNVLEVSVMDNEGNTTTASSIFNVLYATNGFLAPIKLDGTGVYNQGRTIPVKFELRDVVGNIPAPAPVSLYVAKVSNGIVGNDEISLSVSSADIGNQFRYDPNGHTYIYNLSTDSMTTGTWQLKAVISGGQEIKAIISVK